MGVEPLGETGNKLLDRFQSSRFADWLKRLDSWVTWGVVGFVIGLALGVNQLSVILVTVGLGAFIASLAVRGPAKQETEGRLFASGAVFMLAWLVGFVARGLAL